MFLPIFAMLLGAQEAASITPEAICPSLPVGTPLKIAVMDSLLSRTAHNDDFFRIQLAEPLIIDGKTIIAAGTAGVGQVVQASHPTFFNNGAGELVIAARYLELGGKHLPLRSFRIIAQTQSIPDRKPFSYSTNVDIPAGSVATAKVAGECVVAEATPIPPSK